MIMVEARQTDRVRALLRARIIFNNGNSTVDCTIKNVSPAGAKIELSNTTTVPAEFDIEVPQRGKTYRARIVWRDLTALGVTFVAADVVREPEEMSFERLARENRRLKAMVAVLAKRLEELGQDTTVEV